MQLRAQLFLSYFQLLSAFCNSPYLWYQFVALENFNLFQEELTIGLYYLQNQELCQKLLYWFCSRNTLPSVWLWYLAPIVGGHLKRLIDPPLTEWWIFWFLLCSCSEVYKEHIVWSSVLLQLMFLLDWFVQSVWSYFALPTNIPWFGDAFDQVIYLLLIFLHQLHVAWAPLIFHCC